MMESCPYTSPALRYIAVHAKDLTCLILHVSSARDPSCLVLHVGSARPYGPMAVPTQGGLLAPGSGILFLGWTSYIFTATGPPDGLGASTTSMGDPGLPESRHYYGVPVNHTHDSCPVFRSRITLISAGQTNSM